LRRLASKVNPTAKTALGLLVDRQSSVEIYRDAFYRLGVLLGERVGRSRLGKSVMLVCTSEDADFLARGILDFITERTSVADHVAFACFWHARLTAIEARDEQPAFDVAPVVKRYEEPSGDSIDSLIIAKSIISSSCVVRHALLDVIGRKRPKRIFIAAPVILRGAQDRLREEFPADIARRFQFFYFAEDDEKDAKGNVSPGIGGSVYERLGIAEQGLGFVPLLVRERRSRYSEIRQ
jgi:hypothetical protein